MGRYAVLLLIVLGSLAPRALAEKADVLDGAHAMDGHSLSAITFGEMETLTPSEGGILSNLWNDRYVLRVAGSTFVLAMPTISVVTIAAILLMLLFFTPLGFTLFRAAPHRMIGRVLLILGMGVEFGEMLVHGTRKHLERESSASRAYRAFMMKDFLPLYKQRITAVAFLGTAFLILVIGLRGVKFIAPHRPDLVLLAIVVEVTVLGMLGLSTWYELPDESPATGPASDTVRLPNGEYVTKEYILDALHRVIDDLGERASTGGVS